MKLWDEDNLHVLKELKNIYNQREIPDELPRVIQNAIENAEKEKEGIVHMEKKIGRSRKTYLKTLVGIAATIAIFTGAFGIGVNKNETFAASMENIPILGSLVKIFAADEIHEANSVSTLNIRIPEVDGMTNKDLQSQINQDVSADMSKAIEETKKILEEYKQARMETGTTEEEYVPTELIADFEVKCNSADYLSFKVWVAQDFASAYYQEFYYNYEIKESKKVTLEDLLGEDYISISNKQIAKEIAERIKDPNNTYFGENEGGFQTIETEQPFYINQNGNPVIIFDKYEIAPGYMGMPEFEIYRKSE